MRGKGCFEIFVSKPLGITPAYAGKSRTNTASEATGQDHPRICGEKSLHKLVKNVQSGSPPHMRGKGSGLPFGRAPDGITPAYAGKSSPGSAAGCHARDHPRICGEKGCTLDACADGLGSPPHMRGKGHLFCACLCKGWDHPRICGEKTKKIP